jgi:hypothetical protein
MVAISTRPVISLCNTATISHIAVTQMVVVR